MSLPKEVNTLKCIKQTQDLIVSILIGNSWIVKSRGGNQSELHFKLKDNKHFFLKKYLDSNQNTSVVIREVNIQDNIFAVEHSTVLERILRDWTNGNNVIAINPNNLSPAVFMLWICLFGERFKSEAFLENTTMSLKAAKTLCEYYPKYMESAYIVFANSTFTIGALDEVFLYSIRNNRPSYETLELGSLLPHDGKLNELKRVAEGEI